MPSGFLDSSVLIGLHFRHAGEKAACNACLANVTQRETSRYAIFEIARGFLLSLINLHNKSFEHDTFSSLHQAAHSGQLMYQTYKMQTWMGAFDDFFARLEEADSAHKESQKLMLLRSFLWQTVRRGWTALLGGYGFHNDLGCHEQLPNPKLNEDGRIEHALPTKDCGGPTQCGILNYVAAHRGPMDWLTIELKNLPATAKKGDTDAKHVDGMMHLLDYAPDKAFDGKKCHRCGDLLICVESPAGHIIATKNEKDFLPIATILGKQLTISKSAVDTLA